MIKPTLDEILEMEVNSHMENVEREIAQAKFTNRMNLISGCLSIYSALQASIIIGAISGVKED
jgi:hypothetical protein